MPLKFSSPSMNNGILLAPGIQAFAPTIPGAAQPLGKEFPASAPWIIQGAIKFSQSSGHKGVVANE